ncbi:hypothetical protein S7335_2367 [Synechococcus sp. PCC 7335]|uniref:hypothetical protein n=1 Tax=Synechococcus sp. (strain ATCC 29403 / PCC 7335) TaxID=91464 RepID=UPI00017EE710|nr:hypothetical protein [Synechococcus sp. PCC 7335]EDX84670.1 hypothetical protein S7335_2367 [Synechococcus sp. PCC 7335]
MNNHQVHRFSSGSLESKSLEAAAKKTIVPEEVPEEVPKENVLSTEGLDRQLPVVVCPGFNQAELTEGLVRSLPQFTRPYVVPSLPILPFDIYQWLSDTFGNPATQPPLIGIGFSAGVVGLAGAFLLWQQAGGKVAQLFAIDGWGVPVLGLNVIRISHDRFTHLTTLLIGAGELNFYADPGVDHLSLWGSPDQAMGRAVPWWQVAARTGEVMSAKDFLVQSLAQNLTIG